jgi:hypothetical protein
MSEFFKRCDALTKLGDHFISQHGLNEFHAYAQELLIAEDLPSLFDFQKMVERSFASDFMVEQTYKFAEFSDYPVTVSRGERCFIDLYFWRRRPTAIHNHHFRGAFQCLKGLNVDYEYEFNEIRKLGQFHSLGELKVKGIRTIKTGETVEINFLDKFIHQNHHQDELTVNLCFRTPEEKTSNIANYLFSGLRFEKSHSILSKVERLVKLCALEDFDFTAIDINHDEAINFLIQTYENGSRNRRLIAIQQFFMNKISDELQVDIADLLKKHDQQMDKIQSQYE